jgi:hypothetical protein
VHGEIVFLAHLTFFFLLSKILFFLESLLSLLKLNNMLNNNPLLIFNTSNVYCSVFPHPHPETGKYGLYKVGD